MKQSVLQLKQLFFSRVLVESAKPPSEVEPGSAVNFDFQDVTFYVDIETGLAEGQIEDPKDYIVRLNIAVKNTEGKPAPYKLDVDAIGFFMISETVDKMERLDIVTVNGASLLYGAIREVVSTFTGRSIAGTLMLPTMNFQEHRKNKKSEQVVLPPTDTAEP